MSQVHTSETEVALVGGGIMSATLGSMLRAIDPKISIRAFERLGSVALESSDAMNNAGTGHAANCELNYTPFNADGSINGSKAYSINEQFETTLQFWANLVAEGSLPQPSSFMNPCPHISFVWGEEDVAFLRKRHELLKAHPFFANMEYTEDRARIAEWAPLIMEGRESSQRIAATRVDRGSDINFGALTHALFGYLASREGFRLDLETEVRDLERTSDGRWKLELRHLKDGSREEVLAKFVFLGAGGRALPLLLKSGIPESQGYGAFPVSGQWLVCRDPAIVARHASKVYGKAQIGAPPMSVPHLDTRIIDGRKTLLFGPYAGFSTKFLKTGSYLDLPRSLKPGNLGPMLGAGASNLSLISYLVGQVLQSPAARIRALDNFLPGARAQDWELSIAGQRVQIIKRDKEKGGKIEFGTEVVSSADGSIAALLGASPGASTAVPTMVSLLVKCLGDRVFQGDWKAALARRIPSFGRSLAKEAELLKSVRARDEEILGLRR